MCTKQMAYAFPTRVAHAPLSVPTDLALLVSGAACALAKSHDLLCCKLIPRRKGLSANCIDASKAKSFAWEPNVTQNQS